MTKDSANSGNFPKSPPQLTKEQRHIREDFLSYWLEILPQRYVSLEKFNHNYPLQTFRPQCKTLEIGAGRGEHLSYENLDSQEYFALEMRPELAKIIKEKFPKANIVVADCQKHLDFPDNYFDRVLAIHVLEHLPNLPKALDEAQRILKPGGFFSVLIPCEGGFAYKLARNISARRIFEKRYPTQNYDWFIACEHINTPDEIIAELLSRFKITHRHYFPLRVPITSINLVIGLTLTPLKQDK